MESVGDKVPNWEPAADRGLWALSDPRLSNPAKMRKKYCWVNIAVCPRLQLISHTQPTSTLSRIKCERYIFYKEVCSFVHWSSYIMFDYVSAYICICICMRLYNTRGFPHQQQKRSRSFPFKWSLLNEKEYFSSACVSVFQSCTDFASSQRYLGSAALLDLFYFYFHFFLISTVPIRVLSMDKRYLFDNHLYWREMRETPTLCKLYGWIKNIWYHITIGKQ